MQLSGFTKPCAYDNGSTIRSPWAKWPTSNKRILTRFFNYLSWNWGTFSMIRLPEVVLVACSFWAHCAWILLRKMQRNINFNFNLIESIIIKEFLYQRLAQYHHISICHLDFERKFQSEILHYILIYQTSYQLMRLLSDQRFSLQIQMK